VAVAVAVTFALALALAKQHGQQALALQTIERLDPRAF